MGVGVQVPPRTRPATRLRSAVAFTCRWCGLWSRRRSRLAYTSARSAAAGSLDPLKTGLQLVALVKPRHSSLGRSHAKCGAPPSRAGLVVQVATGRHHLVTPDPEGRLIEIYFSIVQRKVTHPQRLPRPHRCRATPGSIPGSLQPHRRTIPLAIHQHRPPPAPHPPRPPHRCRMPPDELTGKTTKRPTRPPLDGPRPASLGYAASEWETRDDTTSARMAT